MHGDNGVSARRAAINSFVLEPSLVFLDMIVFFSEPSMRSENHAPALHCFSSPLESTRVKIKINGGISFIHVFPISA